MSVLTLEDELQEILRGLGEHRDEGFPVFNCCIRDARYRQLVDLLIYRQEHLEETEEQNRERNLQDIYSNLSPEQIQRDLTCHEKMQIQIQKFLGLDYGDWIKSQRVRTQNYTPRSLPGIPFQLADPHNHAHSFIRELLIDSPEPVAIIRLDAHTDCKEKAEEKNTRANYVSQLTFDEKLSQKISRIIHIGGSDHNYSTKINKINYIRRDPFLLPEVHEPAIIDIDLDGCENGGEKGEFNEMRSGGHIYRDSRYYNQNNMAHHPRAVARILKAQVQNPLGVAVALERGYRNRLFWCRVERDFMEELAT